MTRLAYSIALAASLLSSVSCVEFISPPPVVVGEFGDGDYSRNPVYPLLSRLNIRWTTGKESKPLSILLYQMNKTEFILPGEYIGQSVVQKTEIDWLVATGADLSFSSAFFLSIFEEGQTAPDSNSRYFNITDSKARPESQSSTTGPTSSATSSATTSSATPTGTDVRLPSSSSSPGPLPPPPPSEPESSGGLSTGAKVGLGVGIPVALALGLVLGFFILRRRKQNKAEHGGYQAADSQYPQYGGMAQSMPPVELASQQRGELDGTGAVKYASSMPNRYHELPTNSPAR
ncbi:hypothetical protein M011DRAFT_481828 [Sporormia fimetaria CBS 119925]|uniref:Mid2 domain-containing protein n=1 Tax=Sporormia fimetaria CBS 119925 TaxID=1340428 RepID=A0A6A6UVD6_9PLEO|nr:hypothetical protein M011DRAFT_481828 [Sporormia fimetaria CBS 119925]